MDVFGVCVAIMCIVTLVYDYKVDKGVRKELVKENNNFAKLTSKLNTQIKLEQQRIELLQKQNEGLWKIHVLEKQLMQKLEEEEEKCKS